MQREKYDKEHYDFEDLREIIAVLRSPQGCPWDRVQTHESMENCLIEECYEVVDAVRKKDVENLKEELGDVLLQVLLHAQIGQEEKAFSFDEIVDGLAKKLVRRHPHVFGTEQPAAQPVEGLSRWEAIKKQEKPENKNPMKNIPEAFPAKMYANKALNRANKHFGIDISENTDIEEVKTIKKLIKCLENMEKTLTNATKEFITKISDEHITNK